jgi:hypothetical protein
VKERPNDELERKALDRDMSFERSNPTDRLNIRVSVKCELFAKVPEETIVRDIECARDELKGRDPENGLLGANRSDPVKALEAVATLVFEKSCVELNFSVCEESSDGANSCEAPKHSVIVRSTDFSNPSVPKNAEVSVIVAESLQDNEPEKSRESANRFEPSRITDPVNEPECDRVSD